MVIVIDLVRVNSCWTLAARGWCHMLICKLLSYSLTVFNLKNPIFLTRLSCILASLFG